MSKKILFFYCSREIGGVDTVLVNLIKTWPDKNDHLEVWLNKGHKGMHLYDVLGVDLKQVHLMTTGDINFISSKSSITSNFYQACCKLRKLAGILKFPIFLYSTIIFYFKLTKDRFDVVFSHNGGYPAAELNLSFVAAAKLAGIKKVFLVVHNNATISRAPFRFLDRILDTLIDHSCSKIISVSSSSAKQLQITRFLTAKKIDFIYNGIIAERTAHVSLIDKMKRLNLGSEGKIIGSIGDYEERKGHEYLIRAFYQIKDEFPGSKLVIIGSRAFTHTISLNKLIRDLHLEQMVFLTGYIDFAWEYIECFDVFVFPSISYESFGMGLLEAMLYKKPIIATNVGGIPEVLADTGIIVEPNDPQQLACAIREVLNNRALAGDMAKKGYDRLINVFKAGDMAEKYHNLCDEKN